MDKILEKLKIIFKKIKSNIISEKKIVMVIGVFFANLFAADILLILCSYLNVYNVNYFHIIFVDITLAILMTLIYIYVCKKKICPVLIIFSVLYIFYITEIIIHNTFSNFFSLKDIFRNAKNVMGNYAHDVLFVIMLNILVIVYYVILVLLIFYGLQKIKISYIKTKKTVVIGFLSGIFIISLVISTLTMKNDISDFDLFLSKNGLKSSVFYNISPNRNQYQIEIPATKEIVETEKSVDEFVTKIENGEIENDNKNDKKVYKEHKWDFDFLAAADETISYQYYGKMNDYIQTLSAAKENEYTGLFAGKNLILICAEAFSKYVIDEELTPTLYRLSNNGFKFEDFYQPCWHGGTSGGEYSFLTGLVPTDSTCSTLRTIDHDMSFTLCNMLKEQGYNTAAFHNGTHTYYDRNLTHNSTLGFDYFMAIGNGLEEVTKGYSQDDVFFDKTFPLYSDDGPFCVYYLTVTGHAFYNNNTDFKVIKYIDRVKERYGERYSDQVNNYLCSQLYLEDGLKKLLEDLEEKNMLNDTVICIVPDHYPYGLTNNRAGNPFTDGVDYVKELYGIKAEEEMDDFTRDKNACILWCGSLENEDKAYVKTIDYPTFTLDIVPTLLNLFGLDYDSRLLVGNDVFSDYEHLVFSYNEDYITDDIICYNGKRPNIEKSDKKLDKNDLLRTRVDVRNRITFSRFVLDTNYYGYLKKWKK